MDNKSNHNSTTPKKMMENVFEGEFSPRIPFAPAIYEHKAFLLGETPTKVARSADLLSEAVLKEYSTYQPDLLTVGLDVYNIEAEALGGSVKFYPDSNNVPVFEGPLVSSEGDISELSVPDPESDGRMPLMLKVGEMVQKELGSEVLIRGAISGPFTLACNVGGQEKVIKETYRNTGFIRRLLKKTTEVIARYAEAWIDAGLGVITFDSLSSPPLISPDTYRKTVKPRHEELFDFLGDFNLSHRPLIIGGDTSSIASDLAEVGADFLLCDYNADMDKYLEIAEKKNLTLRVNLNPEEIKNKPPGEIEKIAGKVANRGAKLSRFVLGTGVLDYDTPPKNVLAVKNACEISAAQRTS